MDPRIASLNDSDHATSARHYLRNWARMARLAAGDGCVGEQDAPSPRLRGLASGHALTLRARRLSVLHISHGRVWLTLTDEIGRAHV